MAPKMIKINNHLKIDKERKELKVIKRKIVEYQNFIKRILNMWEKILRMRQDLFITIKRKRKKEFMVPPHLVK